MIRLSGFKSMTFDCYGTLVDWEAPLEKALLRWSTKSNLNISGAELLELFAQSDWVSERKTPGALYTQILRDNLRGVASRLGTILDPNDEDILTEAVRSAEPFSDTVESLLYLKKYFKLGVLSNIDNTTFHQHTSPKLGVDWDLVITAEDVGSYKPDKPHFAEAKKRLGAAGLQTSEMLHLGVATLHDCVAAKAFGFGGAVWVDRYHEKEGPGAAMFIGGSEDLRVASLAELTEIHRNEMAGAVG